MNINLSTFRLPHRKYALITIALFTILGALAIRLYADNKGADRGYPATSGRAGYRAYGKGGKSYYPTGTIKGEALDEARGGLTLAGTPVAPRTPECFPAEPRDLFWQMDQVASADGQLQPLNFDENGDNVIDNSERDAIRGRNTWLLWGGGDETFWNWLLQKGYGLTDFLILMDSRLRGSRFHDAGLINQPGFETSKEPILGLYLDKAAGENGRDALLRPPQPRDPTGKVLWTDYTPYYRYDAEPEYYDAQGRKLVDEQGKPAPVYRPTPPPNHPTQIFEPWMTKQKWKEQKRPDDDPLKNYIPEVVRERLSYDGLDPLIYGYPSGIFGLRLMLNPDFFGNTKAAARARTYWMERVEKTNGRYYTDTEIHADPILVRPFKVSMSCGFCHIGPHPLNPPKDPENPAWENLSGIIGSQYWDPQPAFGNLLRRTNFLHHFLRSQAPGTVDTSLVSTDQINNTNIINAIFDVPARLQRALTKPTEEQSRENLLLPGIEDPGNSGNQRHIPMVLFPGEDSVGVFGALARVPLNIGVFSEQWARCDNPVLGYTPQRPFRVEVSRANSVYWNVNEKYRVGYMAKFFTLGASGNVPKSTAPMKLRYAGPVGQAELAKAQPADFAKGRTVFLNNCAICHSSKQPKRFDLRFQREMVGGWDKTPVPREPKLRAGALNTVSGTAQAVATPASTPEAAATPSGSAQIVGTPSSARQAVATPDRQKTGVDLHGEVEAPADSEWLIYTLPMHYGDWEEFKKSPAYQDYVRRITELAGPAPEPGADDPFIKDNFLSNELRVPVTLIGTYSGRAMATNAMRGQVWDNYSSETFKNLPSVGKIRFYNPYLADPAKAKADPKFGTNDEYDDGREKGGPGYYRPASLISVWATAPYFHNNALGIYTHDPSVQGRLLAFNDGIRKLLWNDQRPRHERDGFTYVPPGDLRVDGSPSSKNDPGYIYRLPIDTFVMFQPGFIRPLIEGLLVGTFGSGVGTLIFYFLSIGWWVVLLILFVALAIWGRARHAGVFLLLLAIILAVALTLSGAAGYGGTVVGALMVGMAGMLEYSSVWLWCIVGVLAIGGFVLSMARGDEKGPVRALVRVIFFLIALALLFVGIITNKFLNGRLPDVHPLIAVLPNKLLNAPYKGINVGPIPRGTPINLIMNLDPDKRAQSAQALIALVHAIGQIKRQGLTGDAAYQVLSKRAGPALIAASKVPDMVLDRGHWFGEFLKDEDKEALIAFLKTL